MPSVRTRVLPAVALSAATLMIPVSAFAAGSITVTPSSSRDGQAVTVDVTGCSNTAGTATSQAFARSITLTAKQGKLEGTGTIGKKVKPGRYTVQTTCTVGKTTSKVTGSLTVTA